MTCRHRHLLVPAALLAFALPASAAAQTSGGASPDDTKYQAPPPAAKPTPGPKAKIVKGGVVVPPAGAPAPVVAAIDAANKISTAPYRYGGGHDPSFADTAFDCSGAISFALKAADALDSPLDSSSFASWGEAGAGQWITVYTNPGHAYVVIAGVRFDTGYRDRALLAKIGGAPGRGPRWGRPRSTKGFTARHPVGL